MYLDILSWTPYIKAQIFGILRRSLAAMLAHGEKNLGWQEMELPQGRGDSESWHLLPFATSS